MSGGDEKEQHPGYTYATQEMGSYCRLLINEKGRGYAVLTDMIYTATAADMRARELRAEGVKVEIVPITVTHLVY